VLGLLDGCGCLVWLVGVVGEVGCLFGVVGGVGWCGDVVRDME
jgi:hypothetical protein